MKPRTLAVLTVVVGVLAVLVAADRPRPPSDADLRTRLIAGFDAREVQEVRLGAVVVARRGDGWALTAPVAAPADRAAMQDLLGSLEYVSWRRKLPAGAARARGLDDASARVVEVRFTGGRSVRLRIGKSEPALERTWMNVGGQREDVLVDDYFARALDRSVDDLRRHDPLPVDASVTEVRVEAGPEKVLALRAPPPCVVLSNGGACARADGERFAQLVRRLGDLRIARFLDAAAAPAAAPTLRVVAGGHELRAYDACPGAPELTRVDSELGAGCVRADALAALAADAADPLSWVDRAILPFGQRELRRVTMVRGAARLVLEREGGAWQRVVPDGPRVPVDDDAFASWWHDLASFAATSVVAVPPAPAPPLDAPTLELLPDGAPALILWIAPAPGGDRTRVLVRRAGEPVGLVVHADVARYFEPDAVQFAARDVLDFEASSLHEIDVDRGGGVVEKAVRGASLDDWSLTSPLALAADGDAVAALRDAAAHLHAVRAVAARPEAAHGLNPPRLALTLVVDPPPTTPEAAPTRLTLALGALTKDGTCYAQSGAEGAPVFLLDADSCAALAAPLASREVWPERDATALELAPGKRWEHNGPGWYGPEGTRVSDAVAAQLVAALHALGAPSTVVGYGAIAPGAASLSVTWSDHTKSTLRIDRATGTYGLEGRAVRYALPKEACAAFPTLCGAK